MSLGTQLHRAALVSLVGGAAGVACLDRRLRPQAIVPPVSEPGRHEVAVVETRRVVPGPGLPAEVHCGASNNNLDALRHDGWVYLAFRTAPHHFASPHVAIYVVRSRDEIRWELEARFHLGADLREPRLLALGGELFLYVSRLGKDAFDFEPQGISVASRGADGKWSELSAVGPPGYMGWRTRWLGETPVFFVYSGGASIYDLGRPHLEVELWTTADGRSWKPLDPAHPISYAGGGSEADGVLGDDGVYYGVIRNEGGDASGWGSQVCTAPAGATARWRCRADKRKYDSPFAFWHDGEAYLIARRNLNGNGDYDLGRGAGHLLRTTWNQVNYSLSPKRTALWRHVRGENRLVWVTDLPSRGDCCFPAVLEGATPEERVVYDYSCALDGPDVPWLVGQRGRTYIHRHVLRFAARA